MSESHWIERAQSAEAKLKTLRESYEPAIERVKNFKANFGVREKSNGEIVIDFPKFVERLGPEAAAQLKSVIDEQYGKSEKPRRRNSKSQASVQPD